MNSREFIEALHRHYAKRHASPEEQTAWLREMVEMHKGTDPRVLDAAYDLVRDEHDERAFPLPAQLKKWIARAAEIVYPERIGEAPQDHPWSRRSLRAPDAPEVVEVYRRSRAWQHAVIKKYGTWANYEAAKKGFIGAAVPEPADVSRPAFEAMQSRSRNQAMHVDLGALSRRIVVDRE